jgi:sec-independent protein translocase protein TatB
MSLPDTIFIFVLALVIFGPKKLPEIGRQIGKLVGEFRRASNEFKFQIEEELRQADIMEKPATRQTIAAPAEPVALAGEAVQPPVLAEFPEDAAMNLPVGQYPNIDTLNTSMLDAAGTQADAVAVDSTGVEPPAVPVITPAEGSMARTTVPFAPAAPQEDTSSAAEIISESAVSPQELPSPPHPDSVSAEAEITHG